MKARVCHASLGASLPAPLGRPLLGVLALLVVDDRGKRLLFEGGDHGPERVGDRCEVGDEARPRHERVAVRIAVRQVLQDSEGASRRVLKPNVVGPIRNDSPPGASLSTGRPGCSQGTSKSPSAPGGGAAYPDPMAGATRDRRIPRPADVLLGWALVGIQGLLFLAVLGGGSRRAWGRASLGRCWRAT